MDPPAVDAPRIDAPHLEFPVRKDPPFSDQPVFTEPQQEGPRVDPPTRMTPATGGLEQEPPRVDAVRGDPFEPPPAPAPQFEQERLPEETPPATDLPPSALREETRTDAQPSPSPRRRAAEPVDEQPEPPSRPRLAPANGVDKHSQAFVDDILNTQERNLLRELQDELARREQQEPQPQNTGSWHVDRSGRHGKPATAGPFDHPNQTTGPMIINGVPPHADNRGYPPAN